MATKPKRGDLTPGQKQFLEYLVDPTPGKAQMHEWAKANGFSPETLRRWKRDPVFLNAWHYRVYELKIDPGRIGRVVDALFTAAEGGDVRAAQLVFKYLEDSMPKFGGQPAAVDIDPSEMSDAELEDALANEASA